MSRATDKAARAMLDVSSTAEKSGKTSLAVLHAADQLTRISGTLREEVDHFLTAMRMSQETDNRRRYERIAGGDAVVNLRCPAHGPLRRRVFDISLGGAALVCDWRCEVGTEIMITLAGGGPEISSRVVSSGPM